MKTEIAGREFQKGKEHVGTGKEKDRLKIIRKREVARRREKQQEEGNSRREKAEKTCRLDERIKWGTVRQKQ